MGNDTLEILSLPDLVRAKKTQRDKDWPMIRRLVEENYFSHRDAPTPQQIAFWFQELRTPSLLQESVQKFSDETAQWRQKRSVIEMVAQGAALPEIEAALYVEESAEREKDRLYWQPLRAELEALRHPRTDGKRTV